MLRRFPRMLLRKAEAKIGGLNWCATKVSSASCSSSIKPLSESRSQRKLASVVCQERAGLEVAARGPVRWGLPWQRRWRGTRGCWRLLWWQWIEDIWSAEFHLRVRIYARDRAQFCSPPLEIPLICFDRQPVKCFYGDNRHPI